MICLAFKIVAGNVAKDAMTSAEQYQKRIGDSQKIVFD